MALMRVYCGLAANEPTGTTAGDGWLTIAIVDDAGRLLDVCDVGDDAGGFVELGALLAERSGGSVNVAVAADSDEHHVTLLLAAAGRPLAIVDEELLSDYADRFGDDDSADELAANPAERHAVGLARALAAGALTAAGHNAPRELMALKPVLSAHAAMAAGRHGTAVALREVLRELYPAALRAYPDPAEPIPLAILDALPEPGLLGNSASGRGRDAAVAAQLVTDGVADPTTIADALTALRVAIAETPRRTGIGKGTTTAVAESIREAVAAVRACDRAISALIGLLSDKGGAVAPVRLAPVAVETSRQATRRKPVAPVAHEIETPTNPLRAPAASRAAAIRPVPRSVTTPRPAVPVPAEPAPTAPMAPMAPAAATPLTQRAATGMPAVAVPPPPPGITPISPAAANGPARNNGAASIPAPQQQPAATPVVAPVVAPAAAKAPMQMPVTPSWALEPMTSFDNVNVPLTSGAQASAGTGAEYAEPGPHAGYGFDSGHDAPAYPLDPQFPAPGSRETWPLNPPSYDEDAVRARSAVAFSYQQAPADQGDGSIPRQRDGRISPPWQNADVELPAEPPALRLIGRDGQRGLDREPAATPALRLVGADEGRTTGEPESPYASPMNDSDGDLLIFAQAARSAWFEWPDEAEEPERPEWTDIDAGWSVAAKVEHPEVGGQTEVGLPRRVPQANLVPGSPLPPMADQSLRIVRDPASMAAHTTGYFRGSRRGEEVRGYAVGGRTGRESGGGWDFSRDGWDSDRDSGYRSAVHR